MSLYLRNATWIDPETFKATTTTIKVEEGRPAGWRLTPTPLWSVRRKTPYWTARAALVTPSFGCGHHHIYSALARGMPPAPKAPANFLEVLEYVWWRMDKKLDHDMIEASALVTGLYCAKNGVTFVIDHHASPFHLDGSLETIAKALDRVGLGHLLCYEISCRDGEEIKEKGLDETDAFLSSGARATSGCTLPSRWTTTCSGAPWISPASTDGRAHPRRRRHRGSGTLRPYLRQERRAPPLGRGRA